jgi:hypothetical protein
MLEIHKSNPSAGAVVRRRETAGLLPAESGAQSTGQTRWVCVYLRIWSGGRAAQGARLLSVWVQKARVGSNPTHSAKRTRLTGSFLFCLTIRLSGATDLSKGRVGNFGSRGPASGRRQFGNRLSFHRSGGLWGRAFGLLDSLGGSQTGTQRNSSAGANRKQQHACTQSGSRASGSQQANVDS